MKVKTGFGYLIKDGKITDKYVLPIGEHPLKEGYEFVEVANQEALEAVEVYKEPISEEVLAAREVESLIEQKKREMAIRELKAENKLDANCKVTASGKLSLDAEEVIG